MNNYATVIYSYCCAAITAATDSGTSLSAVCSNITSVDRYGTTSSVAAADTCTAFTSAISIYSNNPSIDGNTTISSTAAANSCSTITAFRRDFSAVDGNLTAALRAIATDCRAIAVYVLTFQYSHRTCVGRLSVDRQAIAVIHTNALGCSQRVTIH